MWLNNLLKTIRLKSMIISLFLFALPLIALAQQATLPIVSKAKLYWLNSPLPGLTYVQFSGEKANPFLDYLKVWYSFIVGSVGIIATVMIMYAGLKWLTSRGNSSTIGDAKTKIWSAIIGLLLAFFSYTILFYLNPALTEIKNPGMTPINFDQNLKINSDGHTFALARTDPGINPATGALNPIYSKLKVPCTDNGGPDYFRAFTASYEGFDYTPVREANGSYTWGIGHNSATLAPGETVPTVVDPATENTWYQNHYMDYYNATASAYGSGFSDLSPQTAAVLTDMSYQLGYSTGPNNPTFRDVIASVRAGDRTGAANIMRTASNYGQHSLRGVQSRARENANILENDDRQAFVDRALTSCE